MEAQEDSHDPIMRLFLYCSRRAMFRPIARLIRFLQPMLAARTAASAIVAKISQDPGLPCSNPTSAFWQTPPDPDLSNIQSPVLPEQSDVLIIGSGISAASIAHHLLTQDPNITVVICEARTITSGATGRNGGHIIDLPYDEYDDEVSILGTEEAKKLVRFRMGHLPQLVEFADTQLSEKAKLYSEIRTVETVDAFFDEAVWTHMREQFNNFLTDFPEQRERWRAWDGDEAKKKFGMPHVYGAISGPAGAIWPYRFVTGVYKNVMEKCPGRLSIETNTAVVSIDTAQSASDHPYLVHTSRGAIRCRNIVHATNGHVGHLLPRLRGRLVPLRGQMTVQSMTGPNAPANVGDKRSWLLRHGKGYDYMTQSASTGDYYLGGGALQGSNGGLDAIGNPADSQQDFTALCHLRGLLPMLFEQESVQPAPSVSMQTSWTGTLGFSSDGRPWVGKIPSKLTDRSPQFAGHATGGEWISAGFCGNGMVYCWRSGQALASTMLGRQPEYFPESLRMTQERFDSTAADDMANHWLSLTM